MTSGVCVRSVRAVIAYLEPASWSSGGTKYRRNQEMLQPVSFRGQEIKETLSMRCEQRNQVKSLYCGLPSLLWTRLPNL